MTKEQIKTSKEKNELKLSTWEKFTHYGIVLYLFVVPFIILILEIKEIVLNEHKKPLKNEIWIFLITFSFTVLLYILQKRKLKFKIIDTKLSNEEIKILINEVAEERKWIKTEGNQQYYIATTQPGFFSGSWGELITILFDKNRIYFNSICNPNAKSSVTSMGRNKKNFKTLLNKMNK